MTRLAWLTALVHRAERQNRPSMVVTMLRFSRQRATCPVHFARVRAESAGRWRAQKFCSRAKGHGSEIGQMESRLRDFNYHYKAWAKSIPPKTRYCPQGAKGRAPLVQPLPHSCACLSHLSQPMTRLGRGLARQPGRSIRGLLPRCTRQSHLGTWLQLCCPGR